MNRRLLIKNASLLAVGTILPFNIVSPENLGSQFSLKGIDSSINPDFINRYAFDDNELWVQWLAKLVATTLITNVGAKIVEKWFDDCICDETTCRKSPENYSNANGIYGYSGSIIRTRFVEQDADDYNVNFTNKSVPFLDSRNNKLGNVEGPFLAGLCMASDEIYNKYGKEGVLKGLIPIGFNRNGGYRFDVDPCYPTTFKTEYGRADLGYVKENDEIGTIYVSATKSGQLEPEYKNSFRVKYNRV